MGKLRLTLACWDYDRTRALQDGRVEVEGVRADLPAASSRRDVLAHAPLRRI